MAWKEGSESECNMVHTRHEKWQNSESEPHGLPKGSQGAFRHEHPPGLLKNNTKKHQAKDRRLHIFKKNIEPRISHSTNLSLKCEGRGKILSHMWKITKLFSPRPPLEHELYLDEVINHGEEGPESRKQTPRPERGKAPAGCGVRQPRTAAERQLRKQPASCSGSMKMHPIDHPIWSDPIWSALLAMLGGFWWKVQGSVLVRARIFVFLSVLFADVFLAPCKSSVNV